MLLQKNKQTSSIGPKALKLAVFLEWAKPSLRIPLGTRFVSQTLPLHKNNSTYNLNRDSIFAFLSFVFVIEQIIECIGYLFKIVIAFDIEKLNAVLVFLIFIQENGFIL